MYTIVFGENSFTHLQGDMEITNLPELKKIIIKQNALPNLETLLIHNNDKLKTIVIEKEDDRDVEKEDYCYISEVIIESSILN